MSSLRAGRRQIPRAGKDREVVLTDRLHEGAVGNAPHHRCDEEGRSVKVG
jgi:hypothetical protein